MPSRDLSPHLMALQDIGNLAAPPGSIPWARAIHAQLSVALSKEETSVRTVRDALRQLEDVQGYQHLYREDGSFYASLHDFATAKPPFGLGFDPEVVFAIVSETRALVLGQPIRKLREKAGNPDGHNQYSPIEVRNCVKNTIPQGKMVSRGSTNRAYLLPRLKRDAPEIFAALERGEYRSARAAAKAAGIVRDSTPLEVLSAAWRKVSEADLLCFLSEVLTPSQRKALAIQEYMCPDMTQSDYPPNLGEQDE